ncbi:MAG: TOBE domain-containing protein, partial [Geminicoccaceae bacterium]
LYHHPDNLFVAGFIGSPKMNFLEGEVASATGNAVTVALPTGEQVVAAVEANGIAPGQKVTLGVRPEHLIDGGTAESRGDAEIKGKAIAVEHLGGETFAYLDRGGDEPLVIKNEGDAKIGVDETVPVGIRSETCYLFDQDGKAFTRKRAA